MNLLRRLRGPAELCALLAICVGIYLHATPTPTAPAPATATEGAK